MTVLHTSYAGASGVRADSAVATMAFATSGLRPTGYFRGVIERPSALREALGALHGVVVSDFRYRPKDRSAFEAWAAEQDRAFIRSLTLSSQAAREELERAEARLAVLAAARRERRGPFVEARARYVDYVYTHQYELQYLLDPVITVHPDELFFEAFSQDESSYARLGVSHELFSTIDGFECGTTNIDFSAKLARHFERLRTYRQTTLDIGPGGLSAATAGAGVVKEKKIDLPESWVQGFLQVQSTMTLGLTRFVLSPVDVFNLLRYLHRHRTRASPRALRYELVPGERIRAVFEPTGHVVTLSARHEGDRPASVRTWGRDRLKLLGRLLPVARKVTVSLAGFGLPSVYDVDLGPLRFTLALSGWTDNDWAGGGRFELLGRRVDASALEVLRVYEALRGPRFAADAEVARLAGLPLEKVRSALSFLCQAGRAMFDLGRGVYRHRDLFFDGFGAADAKRLTDANREASDPQAKAARAIFASDNVRVIARRPVATGYKLSGSVLGTGGERVRPQLHVDREGHVIEGSCTCRTHQEHQLTRGPCEHLLALRLAHMQKLEEESQEESQTITSSTPEGHTKR
jgi:hypothetical protein